MVNFTGTCAGGTLVSRSARAAARGAPRAGARRLFRPRAGGGG